ncbi:MAG TPA: cysteine desulfurase family protein [Xanthobacteraceae bacterium]
MTQRVYLDWNATAPLRPEARAAVLAAQALCGNASSIHAEGRAAHRLIEEAREDVAALVGAEARNVVFTSGGTEANVLALSPATGTRTDRGPRARLLVSAIEHPSVLAGGRFDPAVVERLPVTPQGRLDLLALEARLAALAAAGIRGPLVSAMLANNESGIVQPIAEAAAIVHQWEGILHVDAVQAAGRIPFAISDIGADLVTLSGHKIGAPMGAGALVRRDAAIELSPVLTGGGQERGARAGTQNVTAIAGFGAAAAAVRRDFASETRTMRRLQHRLEAGLKSISPNVIVFGHAVERLPNTTLFAVPDLKGETAVIAFDLKGVAVSSGAACSSGKVQPSHVLEAMGIVPALARGAVRVSLGASTTEPEVDRFLEAWIEVSGALLKGSKGIAA